MERNLIRIILLSGLFFVQANDLFSQGIITTDEATFVSAKPVWPEGRQLEKNLTVGFRATGDVLQSSNAEIRIAGSSLYRVFLNGVFIAHGPARAAHGFYRLDRLDISDKIRAGTNVIAIEVAGYNVNSYYLLNQPSFLQAEIIVDGKVVAATGKSGFEATEIKSRVQKVPRYSFQRPFIEVYNLANGYDLWMSDISANVNLLECEVVDQKEIIRRRIKYSDFEIKTPSQLVSKGNIKTGQKRKRYWKDRAVTDIGDNLGGFREEELTINPSVVVQEMDVISHKILDTAYVDGKTIHFSENSFKIVDFGLNNSGFIGAEINCDEPCTVYFTFDEILSGNDVDFKRLSCINVITYNLAPGKYPVESFEPYTLRYLKIIVTKGSCRVNKIYLREYVNPDISRATFFCSDERINRIYKAGVETFKQNVVDIFMDCPSRERAGWLCDSYFSARVANVLSGNTLVEKNFFENYLLPDKFENLPEGMLPMCYPADHSNGNFIPNWAMWFVLQLEEYLYRSNDREMVDALKPKILDLVQYLERFRNSDGLLENLERWIFVEWSRANSFVQDVNYPTNMLYSAMLESIANLYNLPELRKQAEQINSIIREQSYNGEFFVDNAVRNNEGKLLVTSNTTEVCQYFAFFFNIASPETYPELWNKLANEFGPRRNENGLYPKVYPANAFIGNYLRLELLSRWDENVKILEESVGFFDYMALRTGTLWENISTSASCNHGFASHVVQLFYRDVLGVFAVDRYQKKVTIKFTDSEITQCKGEIPVGKEMIKLSWEKVANRLEYKILLPKKYTVEIINKSGLELVRK